MEEIKSVRKIFGIDDFMFLSDTFTVKEELILELCGLIERNAHGISWICNSRTDTLTEKIALAMKRAGCWLVSLGIESGDENILKNIKKDATIDDAKRSVSLLQKAGIKSIGYYMFGLPGETKETMEKTISLAKELGTDYAYFFTATPFPGTEYFEMAERDGWLKSKDWERYSQGRSDIISFEGLNAGEISSAVQKAYRTFYLRPTKIFREISEIKNLRDIFQYLSIGWKLVTGSF